MTKCELRIFEDLGMCRDSMLFDSGTQIATYGTDDDYVSLEVCGEVRVFHKNSRYGSASEMPNELLAILAGDYWENNEVEVVDNNWFDYVHILEGKVQHNDLVCKTDLSKLSPNDLKQEMEEVLNWFHE